MSSPDRLFHLLRRAASAATTRSKFLYGDHELRVEHLAGGTGTGVRHALGTPITEELERLNPDLVSGLSFKRRHEVFPPSSASLPGTQMLCTLSQLSRYASPAEFGCGSGSRRVPAVILSLSPHLGG